jgi:DNA recombination protein RmuC
LPEYHLRCVVEMAGMTAHVNIREQAGTDQGCPDMIFMLPNRDILHADATAHLQAYLDAMEGSDDHV